MLESALCSVCYLTFGLDNRIAAMPCGHTFHEDCLKEWLQQANANSTCPYCRCALNQNQRPICLKFNAETEDSSGSNLSLKQLKQKLKQLEKLQTLVKDVESEVQNVLKDDAAFSAKQMAYGVLLQSARLGYHEDNARTLKQIDEVTKLELGYEICKQANSILKYTKPELLFAIFGFTTLSAGSSLKYPALTWIALVILYSASVWLYRIMLVSIALTVGWTKLLIHPYHLTDFVDIQKTLYPKSFGYCVGVSGTTVACLMLYVIRGPGLNLPLLVWGGPTVSFVISVINYGIVHTSNNLAASKIRIMVFLTFLGACANCAIPFCYYLMAVVAGGSEYLLPVFSYTPFSGENLSAK